MRSRILNHLLTILSALLVELALMVLLVLIFDSPVQTSYAKPAASVANLIPANTAEAIWTVTYPKLAVSGMPIRLKIPKIEVDAAFESVGLTAQGAVGVPAAPAHAAWYNLSPRPGDSGSSIITGHYGPWRSGAKSVFNDLGKLRAGDKIYIENDKGEVITFIVKKIRSFDKNASAAEIFSANDDAAHLNLITCEGIWNSKTKTYSERLVIFADKE